MANPSRGKKKVLTICSLTVLPSSSMVRIFCKALIFLCRDTLASWGERVAYEVDTNSRDIRLSVGIVGEPQQQTGLSYTGVSDEEELKEIVVSVGDHVSAVGWL
jgi:hypothetical protein